MNEIVKVLKLKDIISDQIDDEIIVIDLEKGVYFSLKGDLREFWKTKVESQSHLESDSDIEFANLLATNNLIQTEPTIGLSPRLANHPLLMKFTDLEDLLVADPIHDLGV